MAQNYKTKYKSITFDAEGNPDSAGVGIIKLSSKNLGWDPMRRATTVLVSGLVASNKVELLVGFSASGARYSVNSFTASGSGQVAYLSEYKNVYHVQPKYLEIKISGGTVTADYTIEVQGKHLPTTMRKE